MSLIPFGFLMNFAEGIVCQDDSTGGAFLSNAPISIVENRENSTASPGKILFLSNEWLTENFLVQGLTAAGARRWFASFKAHRSGTAFIAG
jgi:hypothetical protein